MGELFRDALVDLLTLCLTGHPLPLPKDVHAARRGSDLSVETHHLDDQPLVRAASGSSDSSGFGEDGPAPPAPDASPALSDIKSLSEIEDLDGAFDFN